MKNLLVLITIVLLGACQCDTPRESYYFEQIEGDSVVRIIRVNASIVTPLHFQVSEYVVNEHTTYHYTGTLPIKKSNEIVREGIEYGDSFTADKDSLSYILTIKEVITIEPKPN